MEGVVSQINDEYMFSYSLFFLGTQTHQVQIKIQSDEGSQILQYSVVSRSIWPESQKVLTFGGIAVLFLIGFGTYWVTRPKLAPSLKYKQPGFQILTPGENDKFIELETKN